MKRILTALIITAAAALTAVTAPAAEATVGADLASAYVWRGITLNDGFVFQPHMDVAGLPIDVSVWANLDIDDYNETLNDGQFSEVDLDLSYSLPIEQVEIAVGYVEYLYPGLGDATLGTDELGAPTAEAVRGESDRQVYVSAGVPVLLAPSVSVFYGFDGALEEVLYVEAGLGHDIELAEELGISLGATVGYLNPDEEEAEDGFSHWTATASLNYMFASLGVTYVGQIDDEVLPDGEGAYDTEVFGTLSLSHEF